jgi:uncharacterized protein
MIFSLSHESRLKPLFNHPALLRLKSIDQGGPIVYFRNTPRLSRYDHSVGVYNILRNIGQPEHICLAGLFHDISHTAFSHVADYLHCMEDHDVSYQDTVHDWYIKKSKLEQTLSQHNISSEKIMPDLYPALESPLPDLCADRIEYNLHTAFVYQALTSNQIENILSKLQFNGEHWFFTSIDHAHIMAKQSLFFCKNLWAHHDNYFLNITFAHILKMAVEKGFFTSNDLHFFTDMYILDILEKSQDTDIIHYLNVCKGHYKNSKATAPQKFTIHQKFRGIDPFVKTPEKTGRLSELLPEYHREYTNVKQAVEKQTFTWQYDLPVPYYFRTQKRALT